MITTTVAALATQLRGEVIGDGSVEISGLASTASARSTDLTFADNEKFFALANSSKAGGILVSGPFTSPTKPLIKVPNARIAMALLLQSFFPPPEWPAAIHPLAAIDPTAEVHPSAHIAAHCSIGPRARIGANTVLLGGNHIGPDATVGENVTLHPNVVIYAGCQIGNHVIIHAGTVIGSDGYGYVFDKGHHRKVPQVGNVIIEDYVEIGANAAIDRGALDSTVIGQGTKIDNLVHIAHNVVMGKHCLILGQTGFAGGTELSDYCVIASQSGIAGHLKIGRQATVGAKSGVMRDVPDGATVLGIPAMPDKQTKRQWIATQQLPDALKRLRDLESQMAELKSAFASPPPAGS